MTIFMFLMPYFSVRAMHWLDKLPVWENRIQRKRQEKVAFDFMLKSLAEKEKDVIEEFSDF